MAVLQKFIPILGGALPPAPSSRETAIERNRFFVFAFVTYLLVILLIAMTFAILPFVNSVAAGIAEDRTDAQVADDPNYTDLKDAKFIGEYLPDMRVPATVFSTTTLYVSMFATVPVMIITGIFFWPLWRLARALGYLDLESIRSLHAHAAIGSAFVAAWMIFYLFGPLSLVGALFALVAVLISLLVFGTFMDSMTGIRRGGK